jgi:FdhE protein
VVQPDQKAVVFSWQQRIERARKLSQADSPAQSLLRIYEKAAAFQKTIADGLNGSGHSDIRNLLKFLPQLRVLVAGLGSEPLQKAIAALHDDPQRWSELLLKYWERNAEITSAAEAFLAYLLLQPYAQHVTAQMTPTVENTSPRCPACGNPAQVSVLRELNNGAKRSLLCFLCSTEWEFRRVLCPSCGEQHKDKLPVFSAEDLPQARIEACDTCKSYMKCIDLTKDGHAVPPVDDLATLALDLWAEEQGYTRHQPNMFLLS